MPQRVRDSVSIGNSALGNLNALGMDDNIIFIKYYRLKINMLVHRNGDTNIQYVNQNTNDSFKCEEKINFWNQAKKPDVIRIAQHVPETCW